MREVFDHVAFIGPRSRIDGSSGGNLVLMASDAPFPVEAIEAAVEASGGADDLITVARRPRRMDRRRPSAADDYAPTDQLLTRFG